MRYFVAIDTNVLVSALLNDRSTPGNLLRKVAEETIIPLYNDEILEEYEDVLHRAKFSFSAEKTDAIIRNIQQLGIKIDADRMDFELSDPDDVVFYAVVMEKRKESDAYLVTGNSKHFPKEPFIVTPREMLDIIEHQT
ncbi:MAG: putative toxin-antitoxin system toxin component, PIN family [Oscillospiraceae bacterium]|nr:putative toxin-antitoxin system toxin component, PIN family [Oscillospiraceae bacterium]